MEERVIKAITEGLEARGYVCGDVIGTGATAVVYRVRHRESGKVCACKISEKHKWLSREAELLATLRHPLFPGFREYWETAAGGHLLMEYVEGDSVQSHLDRRGRFAVEETIRMSLELADGLGYLHARNPAVIYRDLKPSNIMIQPNGKIRLLDLGAAAVPEGWKAGTPGYASPEQLLAERSGQAILTPTSDIYTMGIVMHYLLTGRDPCREDGERRPVRTYDPSVFLGIEGIVDRCLQPFPGDRIPDMRTLIHELGAYYHKRRLQIVGQEIRVWRAGRRRKPMVYEKNIWESDYKAELER